MPAVLQQQKKRSRTKVEKLTPQKRLEELHAFVFLCLSSLEDYDKKEISNITGLSLSTIQRLMNGQYTLAVQFGTVQRLGAAAGLKLDLSPYGVKVVVVD